MGKEKEKMLASWKDAVNFAYLHNFDNRKSKSEFLYNSPEGKELLKQKERGIKSMNIQEGLE